MLLVYSWTIVPILAFHVQSIVNLDAINDFAGPSIPHNSTNHAKTDKLPMPR